MLYRHYKGGMYLKLFTVHTAELLPQPYVIYLQLYKGEYPRFSLWSRPLGEFYQQWPDVTKQSTKSKTVTRFKNLGIKDVVLWILNKQS